MKNKPNKWRLAMAGALSTMALGGTAMGQSADALIDKLVDKGVLSVKEANDLREEADKDFTKSFSVKSGMPDWVTSLKLNGDVRLRSEHFFYPNDQMVPGGNVAVDRNRFRYRLRFGAVATMKDNLEAGFRLTSSEAATGGSGGDPISGNTTMTSNGSKKMVYLDLAYGKWSPLNNPNWSLTLTGGKMENPFKWSDLVFDADYTPEGAAMNLVRNLGEKHALKLNAGAFAVNEFSALSHDAYLFAGQLQLDSTWSSKFQTTLGVGALSLAGRKNLGTANVPNQNYGNTRDAAGNLVYNYNPIVVDAAATYTLESFPFYKAAFPIKVAGDYLTNPGADKENYAYSVGVTFGKSGKKGLWDLSYRYKYLGADSWYEELVDSDTGGFYGVAPVGGAAGYRTGTNVRGHVAKLTYSATDSLTFGLTYLAMDLVNSYGNPAAASAKSDAGRLQIDVSWKF